MTAAAALWSTRADAQPLATDPAPRAQPRVSITLVGRAGLSKELDDLLVEWFDTQKLEIEIRRQPSLDRSDVLKVAADPQTLRVWMVLASGSTRLYYADPAGERFLVRDIPLRSGLDELGREYVAQVLVTSAEDFLERRASSTPQEIERSFALPADDRSALRNSAPPVPAPHGPGCRFRFGALYAFTMRGPEGVGHGPGALLGMACDKAGLRWVLSMSAYYAWPGDAKAETVIVSVRTFAARWTLAVETPENHPFAFGLEGGAGIDVVGVEPRPQPGAMVIARAAGADSRPVVLIAARGSLRQGEVRFTLSTGISVVLVKTHYDVAAGSQRQTELTPWPVQPNLTLEASWR